MMKIICSTLVILAIMQAMPLATSFIIKTISIQKGYVPVAVPSLPPPDAAIAAYTASKNALIQTVSNAVTEKINTLTAFVNGLVQLKARAKQDLWRTTVNASNGVINSVNGIIAAKPTVFTKTISVGWKPWYATTTVLPVTTTIASGPVPTTITTPTTSEHTTGYYRRRAY